LPDMGGSVWRCDVPFCVTSASIGVTLIRGKADGVAVSN
jgi:hypothetical protein